jgi:YD repeat-containing protein
VAGFGVERSEASVPTVDTERLSPFGIKRRSPTSFDLFRHNVTVDVATGNLLVRTVDASHEYYGLPFGITRVYDAQEQHMQQSFLRSEVNVDPKPKLFGNWAMAWECDASESWQRAYPELQLASGIEANGLFETTKAPFSRNYRRKEDAESAAATLGIPRQTLADLSWDFQVDDFFLRTRRGRFALLYGHLLAETTVDDQVAALWYFNPTSGTSYKIDSELHFNDVAGSVRTIGPRLLARRATDGLGHLVKLDAGVGPPGTSYSLSDATGRSFGLTLSDSLEYRDGLDPHRLARHYLVTQLVDASRANTNQIGYQYREGGLLSNVAYPSSIDSNDISYLYEDPRFPGILTGIVNFDGSTLHFEYVEDLGDNDDRLRPRLKIKRIIDPEGVVLEFDYPPHLQNRTTVTVVQNDRFDRRLEYEHIRDIENTKQRFIASVKTEVRRGFVRQPAGVITPIPDSAPLVIQENTYYSTDGRYNVTTLVDGVGRQRRFEYNDFNQVVTEWDLDGHFTRYTYDNPVSASPAAPLRYDLTMVERQEVLRSLSMDGVLSETPVILTTSYTYDLHNSLTSSFSTDQGVHTTHRLASSTGPRGDTWVYAYDDFGSYKPIRATTITSPLGYITERSYGNRGQLLETVDAQANHHTYTYFAHGAVESYTDANGGKCTLSYYPEADWVRTIEDASGAITEFVRLAGGQLSSTIDPSGDSTDYDYFSNERIRSITRHRPVPKGETPEETVVLSRETAFPSVSSEFTYTPLGALARVRNAKGLEAVMDIDEAGRMYRSYVGADPAAGTVTVFDECGRELCHRDAEAQCTDYTYLNADWPASATFSSWSDDLHTFPDRVLSFSA